MTDSSDDGAATLGDLAICNIGDRGPHWALLPLTQQTWLQTYRTHARTARKPTDFLFIVNREKGMDARVAGKAAQYSFEQPNEQEVLEYWVEGSSSRDKRPYSAACGIVTMTSSDDFEVTSINCPNFDDNTKSHALTSAARYGLREADHRLARSIFVRKLVIYLDANEDFFHRLTNDFRADGIFPGGISQGHQFHEVARLIQKAGIDFIICWAPTKAQIRPHVLAAKAANDHVQLQNARAIRSLSTPAYASLVELPIIPKQTSIVRTRKRPREGDSDDDEENDYYESDIDMDLDLDSHDDLRDGRYKRRRIERSVSLNDHNRSRSSSPHPNDSRAVPPHARREIGQDPGQTEGDHVAGIALPMSIAAMIRSGQAPFTPYHHTVPTGQPNTYTFEAGDGRSGPEPAPVAPVEHDNSISLPFRRHARQSIPPTDNRDGSISPQPTSAPPEYDNDSPPDYEDTWSPLR
ncbi:hypothetical protein FKW77_010892 [Venturia effusa]|uniref:Uncharacterized protein n=1 Tax=Venturia effusa TaxID=50376 RepID=A0A517KYR3_9PEZI|nr:hypothetical protein FKW77_010892 [Venturia effusa]